MGSLRFALLANNCQCARAHELLMRTLLMRTGPVLRDVVAQWPGEVRRIEDGCPQVAVVAGADLGSQYKRVLEYVSRYGIR